MIDDFETGRYLVLKRNPDYWGADVPFMQGQANLDEIRFDYYGDGDVVFEAFKAGEASTHRETNAAEVGDAVRLPGGARRATSCSRTSRTSARPASTAS